MAEFWVWIAFVAFLLILAYYKVPALVAKALDSRAEAIREELGEAQRLRDQAQALLADCRNKHRNVGLEAQAQVDLARREADALAHETRAVLKETLERRARIAEEKIARAEAQALDEVRASVIDMAVVATVETLREEMRCIVGAALVDQSIRDLKDRLN